MYRWCSVKYFIVCVSQRYYVIRKSLLQANESEIPLLHKFNGVERGTETSVEVFMISTVRFQYLLIITFFNFYNGIIYLL